MSNLQIGYTENDLPDITNITPAQSVSSSLINIDYDLLDDESDPASLVVYEYSLTGAFGGEEATMTPSTTDANHDGVSGLSSSPTGVTNTFVWDAQADVGDIYDSTVYVRFRANDGVGDGAYSASAAFAVDYVVPVVSSVSAAQVASSTNVSITYNLADDTATDLLIELDISDDSGSTWNVTDTSVFGDIGSGMGTGSNTITWDAGADFDEQEQSDLQVRVRAKDKYSNQGIYASSTDFSIDTLNPATDTTSNLQVQPNAGDTTVLIGGSFTETNPDTNDFYLEINDGGYSGATAGDTNTASPSNLLTSVGATLDGNDYISKTKITHTDDFGQATDNENTSPTVAYKYVKPYTPASPTLSSPITTQLDLAINKHASETAGLEYLIQETTTGNYVQADGTLGVGEIWQTDSAWGTKTITGLSSPVSQYIFKTKSRNISDALDAASSESDYSATSQITNTAPSISFDNYSQTTDGTQYVTVDYTGTDGQGDINNITVYEYSTNNSDWYTMTEKAGVGSDGISNLIFLSGGTAHDFMWNSGTDVSGVEDSTVYVRLRSTDTLDTSTLVASSAFEIDNILPVVSGVSASQTGGSTDVSITYTLTDANNSTVEIDISDDGGSNWNVTDASVTGHIGAGVTPGSKTITWDAGTDFDNQYQSDIKVRVRALDTFGNQGSYSQSSNFTLDTNDPVVSSVTGAQDSGLKTFVFNYTVSEDMGNVTVGLEISSNGGSSWVVPVTSAAGDIGAGITPGSKTITWDGATDYNGYEENDMQIRITATDQFTNSGSTASSNFSLDTLAPRITSVVGVQDGNVSITYNLADDNWSTIEIDISDDGGSTWDIATSTVTGDVGSSIVEGSGKTITWNANTDFDEQEQSDMRARIRGLDTYSNQSGYTQSANFSLDTVDPVTNVTSDLQAQPNAGDTTVLIGGSFTETNPDTNDFYVEINDGSYSASTAGDTNTASPSNQVTAVEATLDGNDYISKTKITHTDDFGQAGDNENITPSTSLKYVKPYTPEAPTVYNPTIGTVDVLINPHASETSGLEYAIYETTQGKYVQSNGTLGVSAVWQVLGTGASQWGNSTAQSGRVYVNGLVNDSYTYEFQIKSRNISDAGNAASSESGLSTGTSSSNQAPAISIISTSQTTDGTKYVTINYTGTDLESETCSLVTYKYSTDNATWYTMTEKGGVGSDGTSGLSFTSGGASLNFMWDVGTDLNNTEDSTVYIRLQANDATTDGNATDSSAFIIDTKNPVISSPAGSQVVGTNNVTFTYILTDLSNSTVELDISDDSGGTWDVTDTSVTGDVGSGITAGSKTITWNAGTDFNNQDQADLRTQIRALDTFGNQGSYTESADFALDTANPSVTSVSASQDGGANTVTITYDLADTNNSTIEIDISEDGGLSWDVTDTSVTGDVGSGITAGSNSITWDAEADFFGEDQDDIRVRVRAYDIYANGSDYTESANFALDTLGPIVTSVVASQTAGTDNVVFTYDLADASNSTVEIGISEDGGSSWTVASSSLSGDIGSDVTPGSGKSITWDAGTDFNNEDQPDLKVRIRGLDSFTNSGGYGNSDNFSLDTLNPTINAAVDLQIQPNAGDTTVLIGGSFTETNPDTNDFYVAINGGSYVTSTAGDTNTASPSNQVTTIYATLDGNDYISKVKISHADDFNHSFDNENTSPTISLKYVKPYTPASPTVSNPQNTSMDVVVNKNASETDGLEYAIYESTTGNYVQADGTLDSSAVWQTISTWGTKTVTGLTSPVAGYSFQTKSRNTSDPLDASTSESDLSSASAISNTAPVISISSAAQQTGGVNYVLINYTGTDTQNDTNNLTTFEFSTNTTDWSTMTEQSGAGSSGTSTLLFTSGGDSFVFAWDANTDLPGVEDSTVYSRLQSSDTLVSSNLVQSSAFSIDNSSPVISNFDISQTPDTNNIVIEYDLSDNTGSGNTVEVGISEDGGSTWVVASSTLTGDVGAGVTAGVDRSITWDAGTDFNNEEESDMKVRVRGTDNYGNVGDFLESGNFTVDTAIPIVSSVAASQSAGSSDIVITYDLDDGSSAGHLVEFGVSENSGGTWIVTSTSVSGDVGSGQTTGSKTFTWDAGTDFPGEDQSDMRVRVRSLDYYGNQGSYVESIDFSIDVADPVVSGVSAVQTAGTSGVVISYDLSDTSSSDLTVEIDVSNDGGSNWTVTDTSVTGDVGASITAGAGKSITWDAGTDFNNEEQTDMRVRVRATDSFGNISSYFGSSDFDLDTGYPLGLLSFSEFSSTETSVTLNWSSGVSDSNFDHYEIWYGTVSDDVNNRIGTAVEWDDSDDSDLSIVSTISTVITPLAEATYYAKIWGIDTFGNQVTLDSISFEIGEEVVDPEPEPEPEPTVISGGGGTDVSRDLTPPGQPILSTIDSPTNKTRVAISGLADPRSRIDLYNNGNLIERLESAVNIDGTFEQEFILEEGTHILTAKAVDFNNNESAFSNPLILVIDLSPPDAPIILYPTIDEVIGDQTPELIGVSEPFADISILVDGINLFETISDSYGSWSFIVPSEASLDEGDHEFVVGITDEAGNIGSQTSLEITRSGEVTLPEEVI
ncbi:hypothetical protein HOF40_03680, partial [Candidatus Parcubacteria bacterium]|nr:hypothetical protein [Candidatus Parcubacteria bacterium]